MAEERVNPIILTDTDTGEKYTLEFNRESVKFAEERLGFSLGDLAKTPYTKSAELFYLAFRYHHKKLSRADTDKLLDKLGGIAVIPTEFWTRLVELYEQGVSALTPEEEERLAENPIVTVEM